MLAVLVVLVLFLWHGAGQGWLPGSALCRVWVGRPGSVFTREVTHV
jgi:hypothetical protein